jgi:hypothetical protein
VDLLRQLPQELLFVIGTGVVLLIQLVLKQLRGRTGSKRDIGAPELIVAEAREAAASLPAEPQVDPQRWGVAPSPPLIIGPARNPLPDRFSRSALFRDRRDLRKAVVVSVILQPCRAIRPLTMD